jgi:hypothetical protein
MCSRCGFASTSLRRFCDIHQTRPRKFIENLPPARATVAKRECEATAAARKAAFAQQLASIYRFDNDEVWREARAATRAAAAEANAAIARRACELGIPRQFMPSLSPPCWYGRGENGTAQRRAELTRVAYSKIDELQKKARLEIERQSVEIQTRIMVDGLESDAARKFLESMPSAEMLMPAVTVEEVQKQLGSFPETEKEEQNG